MNFKKQKDPTLLPIRETLFNKCKRFGQHSTIHGAYYLCSSNHWWISLIWCCIIAASSALCGFLCQMIWSKFISNPTFTVVESTHYPVEEISFPAVSICDTETVYRPHTNNITDILRLRAYNLTQIEEFYSSFTDIKDKDYKPEAYIKKMHVALEDLGFTYEVLVKQFRKPCDVMLHQCAWRSRVNDCADMFREVFTLFGYCCQFDLSYFRRRAEKNTNFASGIETTEGLFVTVNSRKDEGTNDGYLLLYVFDEHDEVTLLDGSITITPATYFDVTLEVWAIDSSSDVKALSVRSRKCFLKSDSGIKSSSYQDCMMKLIMKKVVQTCRCLPFKYNSEDLGLEEFPSCSWYQLSCVYQTLGRVQSDIHNLTPQQECYQKCDYVQYSTEAEYLKQGRGLGAYNKGHSRITIHFSDATCMQYRREVLYTWDQMLANLGGIFGLCLGGSIISIIEILWFVLELFFTTVAVGYERLTSQAGSRRRKARNARKKLFASKTTPENVFSTQRLPYVN